MRDVLDDLGRWQAEGERIALATLVAYRRSAPRLPGARLVVAGSGRMAGSVSAGCVENDVFRRALQVLETGRPELATYGISDEMGLRVGLGCGGEIDVFIEPFVPSPAWQAAREALLADRPAVLALALAPAELAGRKLALVGEGQTVESIDADLDGPVVAEARKLLATGGARALSLPWRGAEADIFLEGLLPRPRLFIVGATHTAITLSRMAVEVGFRVFVIDPRSPYATRERFPEAEEVLRVWPAEAFDGAALDAHSYVVTLSHDPKFDIPALARALRSPARYVGALGSRKTHERRRARLREEGFTEAELDRIHAPVGLDIGARTPAEIGLSILAEVVAARYGRERVPLQSPVLAGVILAAGTATRMARMKQLLPLAGRPLLQHVLDAALASCVDEWIVVLGHGAEEVRAALRIPPGRRVTVVTNPHPEQGLSGSLRLALSAASARASAAAVLLGDQPGVTPELIDRVASAFLQHHVRAARPVYGTPGGRTPGHPVVLARQIWGEAERLEGDEGAGAFLARHPEWLLEVSVEGPPPRDVDTPEDYERIASAPARSGGVRTGGEHV